MFLLTINNGYLIKKVSSQRVKWVVRFLFRGPNWFWAGVKLEFLTILTVIFILFLTPFELCFIICNFLSLSISHLYKEAV